MILFTFLFLCAAGLGAQGEKEIPNMESEGVTMVRMSMNGNELLIELCDNPTARDLLSRLPLTLTFEDYASTEKITYLEPKLSVDDAPDGYDPSAGDLTLYAPWGNLALFYRDFSYSRGLIPIGRITSGLEKLTTLDEPFSATLEIVE